MPWSGRDKISGLRRNPASPKKSHLITHSPLLISLEKKSKWTLTDH